MLLAIRYKWYFVLLFSAVTLFLGYKLKDLSFEHDIGSFFNKNNQEYEFSQEFFKQFSHDGNKRNNSTKTVSVILQSNKKIDLNFLKDLDQLSTEIQEISPVVKCHSITNQPLFLFTSMGKFPYKIFHLDDSTSFEKDIEISKNYPELVNRYISKDWTSSIIFVELKPSSNLDTLLRVKKEILTLFSANKFEKIQFFSSTLTNHLVVEKLKKESIILTSIAVGFIILILIFFTRSFIGVIIPLSIVIICVIWIIGTITLMNVSLNVLTIAIPVIVGVISLSDVIHIISRFSEEKTSDQKLKVKLTQKDMLKAIVLTSITTSLGFLSLIPSQIQVFVEFGFFSTLGVLYAFVLAYWLLPILLIRTKKITLHNNLGKIIPNKLYPKAGTIGFMITSILCIIGLTLVKSNSFIYDDIEAKDPASEAINTIEKEFYGIRDLSLAIKLKDTTKKLTDFDVINQLDDIQNKADSIYQLNNYSSIITLIKQMNRAKNGGRIEYFKVPEKEKDLKKIWRLFDKNKRYFTADALVSKNKLNTFIYSKIHDVGSNIIRKKNKELLAYVNQHHKKLFEVIPTGGSHLLDYTNFNVAETMLFSLALIILVIVAFISFVFKSIKIGLISIIPNTMPLLVIVGVVGWFDLGLSVSTTIVFTIVFGIAVDDTIHFLSRYQIESKKKITINEKISNCIKTSGAAISLTSIILIAGFGTLMFSGFHANYTTGLLISIGLLTALLCDLFVLPVLINFFDKRARN